MGINLPNRKAKADTGTKHGRKAASYQKVKRYDWAAMISKYKDETVFGEKNFPGSGYVLLQISENGKEITEDNPGYIRVRK